MLDIDVVSFNGYVRHIDRVKRLDEVQRAVAMRAAFNAEKKDFKKWMESMLKDMQTGPDDNQVRKESLAFLRLVGKKGGI